MSIPLLFIISGPAGSGKGTVVNEILKKDDSFICAISATSRERLKGEEDGVNYHYLTREQFEEKIKNDGVLEYTEYCGNYYGTLKSEVEHANEVGKNLILEIEVDGATQIKKKYPHAVLIMVAPQNAREQERRLITRGRDSEASIAKRLARAKEELKYLSSYDYLIINESDGLDKCVGDFFTIAKAESLKTSNNKSFEELYI